MLAIIVMQTVVLISRYQEQGAKLHFIRYDFVLILTTWNDCLLSQVVVPLDFI